MAKKSIFTRLQYGIESVKGQKIMNYLYSWGAAVVILGALCKLTHMPLANLWLFLGMGTEVIVFIVSGFDTSGIDVEKAKRLEAKRRARDLAEEQGISIEEATEQIEAADTAGGAAIDSDTVAALAAAAAAGMGGGGGAPVVLGGGGAVAAGGEAPVVTGGGAPIVVGGGGMPAGGSAPVIIGGGGMPAGGGGTVIIGGGGTAAPSAGGADMAEGMAAAGGAQGPIVIGGGGGGITPVQPISVDETENYVNTLKELTETLVKVNEQASRLTRDSEEMQNLGRTLTGINVIYEQQLKQVSAQMGSMDEINLQTQQMAAHIAELNALYARMIQAMTVNLPAAGGQATQQQ